MGDELRDFIPALKKLGVPIIALTASRSSYLAQHSDIVLEFDGSKEAGCLGLAPTTSATVSLVLGHVLASALMERRGFTADEFARTHPGGMLGRRLTVTVREVMRTGKAVPVVSDFFDFSVYIDADEAVMRDWYVQRFLGFRNTAFHDPRSYFHRYSLLSDDEAIATATAIWERTNLANLEENILPTRPRATLILTKGADHLVETVALRRL